MEWIQAFGVKRLSHNKILSAVMLHCPHPEHETCLSKYGLLSNWNFQLVVSQNRGTSIWTHYTIVLTIGTLKMVPLILGNPPIIGCRAAQSSTPAIAMVVSKIPARGKT